MRKSDINTEKSGQNSLVKKIIMLIIIIIIIILLLTSCTSGFLGKIGNLFEGTSFYNIFNKNKDLPKLYNQNLKFITKNGSLSLDDIYKIEFETKDINPSLFTCTTSKADVATCVVKDNYVEVYPKSEGEVIIFVMAQTNGYEYIATHKLNVIKENRSIDLSSTSGILYLSEGNKLYIPYTLNNINGDIKVSSSDDSIATAHIENGNLIIVAKKTGNVTLTLSANHNNVIYKTVYTLVVNQTKPISSNTKSNNKDLSSLSIDNIKLSPKFNPNTLNYNINVKDDVDSISINSISKDNKAKIYYYVNDSRVNDLNNVSLKYGNNKIEIVVEAEDGSTKKYTININRENPTSGNKSDIKTLDEISLSVGNLAFNKDTLSYHTTVDNSISNINITTKKTSSKSKVTYIVNDNNVSNLNNVNLNEGRNTIKIVVEAENGTTQEYILTIDRGTYIASDINTLDNLTISDGLISFNKETLNYDVTVENGVTNISLVPTKTDAKSAMKYFVDGIEVNSLNNIELLTTKNTLVSIEVTSESNITKVYKVNITRKKSDVNILQNISIDGYNLAFNPTTNNYNLNINYDKENIKVNITKKEDVQTVNYKLNGNDVTSVENLGLKEGINTLEIIVTSESSKVNIYKITIVRASRKVVISKVIDTIYMEESPIDIVYNIYEDTNGDNAFEITEDYNIEDLILTIPTFNGEAIINKGYIRIKPSNDDINNTYDLNLKYNDKEDNINLNIKMNDYYLNTAKDDYDFTYTSDMEDSYLILNTNIFNNDISYTDIDGGLRLYNDKGYVDIKSSNQDIYDAIYDASANTNSSYLAIKNILKASGDVTLTISANVYGKDIAEKVINISVTRKYLINIDAVDGFYDDFTTVYNLLLEEGSIINLGDYVPYKADTSSTDCLYFSIENYNTSIDGSGDIYEKDDVITINSDLDLYAMYSEVSKEEHFSDNNIMYLTEVDLFHNEEYYKLYNIDKVIYPGAHGNHTMYIENNTGGVIEITKINIMETTTCIDSLGCINMGYKIKHTKNDENNWYYYYGSSDNYKILNLDNEVVQTQNISYENTISLPNSSSTDTNTIILESGDKVAVAILWEWVDINNILDTTIGNIPSTQNYELTVSIEYTKTNTYCASN